MIDDHGFTCTYRRPADVVSDAKTAVEWARKQESLRRKDRYNVIWHNCEQFAYFCKYRRVISSQVEDVGFYCAGCLVALCILAVLFAMLLQNRCVWDALPILRWNPMLKFHSSRFSLSFTSRLALARAMKLGHFAPGLQVFAVHFLECVIVFIEMKLLRLWCNHNRLSMWGLYPATSRGSLKIHHRYVGIPTCGCTKYGDGYPTPSDV